MLQSSRRKLREADLYAFDLSDAAWYTSSFSAGGEQCVEVAGLPGGIAVRDSKDPAKGTLRCSAGQWGAFCQAVNEGTL
ncbi:DUF397 domain-containing protein [Streptomyces ginkgonis]|uniref:DUF397 domain-containing protein n=1 Tax=Streptomyces ginkgonis TaxID=1812259 RepID=UPI002176B354|nr:DUF397 domain-containing protein [Streptomyces ginkgonis]